MLDKLKKIFSPVAAFFDLRVLWLIIPAAIVLYADPAIAKTIGYSVVVMFVLFGVVHVLRKIGMPYLDLSRQVEKASESSEGASRVVLAVMIFYSFLVLGTVWWVRG